jgi:hypothetical protein
MSKLTEKLLDLVGSESEWSMPSLAYSLEKLTDATQEMVIIPETPNGPMLEISTKSAQGTTLHKLRLNLPAVDELIGKLIKMRDYMARMKGDGDDGSSN